MRLAVRFCTPPSGGSEPQRLVESGSKKKTKKRTLQWGLASPFEPLGLDLIPRAYFAPGLPLPPGAPLRTPRRRPKLPGFGCLLQLARTLPTHKAVPVTFPSSLPRPLGKSTALRLGERVGPPTVVGHHCTTRHHRYHPVHPHLLPPKTPQKKLLKKLALPHSVFGPGPPHKKRRKIWTSAEGINLADPADPGAYHGGMSDDAGSGRGARGIGVTTANPHSPPGGETGASGDR